ncbi:MAG: sulfatase-like hydrolase/transferase [Pseudomonadota bacterium]
MRALLLLCLWVASTTTALAEDRLPNIILLIGDDHGAHYFGFMGNDTVVTPNMDMIANAGLTFKVGHATANHCRPSLRTLMTGLHPIQYKQKENALIEERRKSDRYKKMNDTEQGMWEFVERAAAMKDFDTLPTLLREQGYASWQGGKWWENSYRNGGFDEGMTEGWDMDLFGTDDFFHEMMGAEGNELGRTTMEPVFDFITRHRDQPFFVWYGPMLPHTPLDAGYKHRKYYDEQAHLSESAKMYYGNVTWWDDGVGQLLDHVAAEGLLEETLFIYINDNGWEQEPTVEYKVPGATYENNLNFSNGGGKGKLGLYDTSFLTPVIFYWKGRIQGSTNTESLVSMEDIVPTILDIAGARVPDGLPGYSLTPLIEGREMDERDALVGYAHQRRSAEDMMGQRAEGYYVRTNRWHFMWYKDTGDMELYDMTVDPKSENNVIDDNKHLVEGFKERIEAWKKKIGLDKPIAVS